jgi:hypothetical protein
MGLQPVGESQLLLAILVTVLTPGVADTLTLNACSALYLRRGRNFSI